jgi:hypothetical protein
MKPIVVECPPISLPAEELAKQLRVEAGTEDSEALAGLAAQAAAVARPRAVYTVSYVTGRGEDFVELDGVVMLSRVMPENLRDVHRVFPFVATCGPEAAAWAKGVADPLQAWWADAVMVRLLRRAIDRLNERLKADLNLGKYSAMNPGSLPDWPISEQPKLFSLLGDVKALIGVELTDSMLMLPVKSVSGFYFETERNFENCELCPREDCPGRRKAYDKPRFKQMNL